MATAKRGWQVRGESGVGECGCESAPLIYNRDHMRATQTRSLICGAHSSMIQRKGIILAGSSGIRLHAATFALSRQLLRLLEDRVF